MVLALADGDHAARLQPLPQLVQVINRDYGPDNNSGCKEVRHYYNKRTGKRWEETI